MSMHPARHGSHSGCLGARLSPKSSSLSAPGHSRSLKLRLKSDMSECSSDDPLLRSAGQIRDVNSTYVISACEKAGETPDPAGKWALQRRASRNKESLLGSELGDPPEKVTGTHLRLQRRPRMGSVDKSNTATSGSVGTWKVAGSASVDKSNTAGSGSVGTWKAAGSGSVDKSNTAGSGSVGTWKVAGSGSVDKSNTAGSGSVGTWKAAGSGSVDKSNTAGSGSVGTWKVAGSGSVDKSNTAGSGSVGTWKVAGSGSVDKSNTAGSGSVGTWKVAGSGSVDKSNTAGSGSVGTWKAAQNVEGAARAMSTVGIVSHCKNSLFTSSAPSAGDPKDTQVRTDGKHREKFSVLTGVRDSVALQSFSHPAPGSAQCQPAVRSGRLAAKPTQSGSDGTVSGPRDSEGVVKTSDESASLETRTPTKCAVEPKRTPRAVPRLLESSTPSFPVKKLESPLLANKREGPQEGIHPPEPGAAAQDPSVDRDAMKVESSQVTVAVRVRPFSRREKAAKASQVVFANGEEIVVRHPDRKHVYNFSYDVLFWSFDERHGQYASQTRVYETLAAPLLARAFEGYNACLFAYGQTGSGKSYTMMGFGEEPGIIPRFCEDLFAQVAEKQTQEVRYHLEMSFFEVYNEKIHDLLACKAEHGQRKRPLRVREHPQSGPYVEALSTNVVSSYSDIQSWLELGNRQRATAATGMNDRSSRSHAVLALAMTQTKTEFVDGAEHDHRISSRINLVDLAGSERCPAAQTRGERLQEGVSINQSLLTLGKVISALSEQASRRGVFVPYRESVLTWLLKESLGGNSKTAMIATVSPAASSVEETLSTLRYASQARVIVNVAKVNEDVSAQLIRELKAEIEKLKAAQRSRRNIDPEQYRLCRQEITSLRMKLHQQERDMAEMQRAWKEKFEQAEKRKLQEIKELQKAGVTFQVDDHLPNLVNLSEDPQLSEMLLYAIKEGTTTVGKRHPGSSRDIQLSGVLVADDHCTIRSCDGTVTIIPVGDAKTYINGRCILGPTVLHHGDRVVLGGDHYFRFNHPAEVQDAKRPSRGDTLTCEGPKDFEFAKNELLVAQRSQLEAEIQAVRLRAKQELLQGVQIAKDVAERELSSQRAAYERRIEALEARLKEEAQRKEMQEIRNQRAPPRIGDLEQASQCPEPGVCVSRKRLQVEASAVKQALEDHSIRHTRILEALEAEKQKIAKEVQTLQQSQSHRDKGFPIQTNWSAMKLSMMVQEANAISSKFKREYVFGRLAAPEGGRGRDTCVRVQNVRLGVSAFWSLEKFESKLAAMKELCESNSSNRSEDIFCDPDDEWEPDITDAAVSSLSRRRNRSLMKNRRVSGCLHDIQVRPSPSSPPSPSSGVVGRPCTLPSSPAEPVLPGICRELIGSSVAALAPSPEEEGSVADSLLQALLAVRDGLCALARAHEDQDEDSADDLFSGRAAQACAVQVACAFGLLVGLTAHWPGEGPPGAGPAGPADELRRGVRKLGAHLQLFLQGCCSDISSMVKDAQSKVTQIVQQAVQCVGQLAVLKGDELHFLENSSSKAPSAEGDFLDALWGGVDSGTRILLDSGIEKAKELHQELLRQSTQNEQVSAEARALMGAVENIFAEWKTKSSRTRAQEENSGFQDLQRMVHLAPQFLTLKECLEQTGQAIISALGGHHGDWTSLRSCVGSLCRVAGHFHGDARACAPSGDGCAGGRRDLDSIAKSLLLCVDAAERAALLKPWESCQQNSGEGQQVEWSRTARPGGGGEPVRSSGTHTPRDVVAVGPGAL